MSDPSGPYRKERPANEVIAPDHRKRDRLILAACSAMVGAIVASITTAFVLRPTAPPQPLMITEAPRMVVPATVAPPVAPIAPVAPVEPPCIIAPGMDTTTSRGVLPMVPRYPGATTRTSYDTGTGGASVILETCATVEEVVAFYRQTKNLDSDGEREDPRGRDFFFSRPAGNYVEQYRVSVVREKGMTKINIGQSTPRMAPTVRPTVGPTVGPTPERPRRSLPSRGEIETQ